MQGTKGDTMRFRALFIAAAIGGTMAASALAPEVVAAAPLTIAPVGSYTITPNPVAAPGSLQPGQAVHLTVTAFSTSGVPDKFAYVWIQEWWFVGCAPCAGPTGTLTVASTCLKRVTVGATFTCKYQMNKLGKLALTYTAVKPPASYGNDYEDIIYASRFSDPGVLGSPYTYARYQGEPGS
jgi:hypothetical protein